MFGNKVLLNWKEPRYTHKYLLKQLTAKDYLEVYAQVIWKWIVGTFILFSILRWLSPREDYSFFDLEILGVVLVVVIPFTLVWLILLLADSTLITMREKEIRIISAGRTAVLSYKEMQSASIGKSRIEEQDFYVLEIKHWNGEESFIEIDPGVSTEDITEILKSRNVQIKPSMFHPV